MLLGLYGFIGIKGLNILQQTFNQNQNTDNSDIPSLDPRGELLLELKEETPISQIKAVLDQFGIGFRRAFYPRYETLTDLDDYYVLDIPDDQINKLPEIEKRLYDTKLVDWIEENEVIAISPVETNKLPIPIEKKFGINDPDVERLWSFNAMKVDAFYKKINQTKIKPKRKATVAILDTGVDALHEDLADNYISTKTKYDKDLQGHGTHCAGIAGAVSNNKIGVASLSQGNEFVQITSIPVLNNLGMGTQKSIIDGMIEAADNRVDVISMSLGGESSPLKQKAYEKVVQYANEAGAIVVVAAGNSKANAKDYAPANVKGVIAVSAVDENLNRATFSNSVADIAMGLAAPGVNIYSTFPKNEYKTFNGTSMATPYVSGLAGVLKSIHPELNTKEVFQILDQSGLPTGTTQETGMFIQPANAIISLANYE